MSLMSPALASRFFTTSATWEALKGLLSYNEVIKLNYKVTEMGFPGGSEVMNLPANAGDVGSILCWEDPLEKEVASHSSILAWRVLWTEEPGKLQSRGRKESDTTK